MCTIPFVSWIANAAARFTGTHGAVTEQAQRIGCSRQCVYDHAQKVLDAVGAQHSGGPTREELIRENEALRRENARLWDWLCQTIEFPTAKQQEFAVTAMAMGLSLNQTLVLLAILSGAAAAPGRSTVHRWVQAAGIAAGAVLKRLDHAAKTLVLVGCLDEIFFHGRPVLVGVEPHSMVWFLGTKALDRKGSTWFAALQPWTALGYVVSDAGTGLQAGIDQTQRHRLQTDGVPLEKGLDVFHTKQEAQRVLRILWSRVERTWEQAEAASRAVEQSRRQGRDARGLARRARAAWKKAEAAFQRYEEGDAAWKCAEAALSLFRPDGELNDRSWAEEQVAAALPGLSGSDWSKVRGFLQAEESFTFLDRLHDALGRLAVGEELRAALVDLWWLRRQRRRGSDPAAIGGYRQVAPLVQQLLCQRLDPNWQESYRQVASVLSRAVRASSAVECMNSVLRMHQSRHRTLSQEMLDLKRLYWNTRAFRGGKRRGRCPYEHLGLNLPGYRFWSLLQDEMDTAISEAKAKAKARRIAA
jgi:tetratricopeptide (TPR) repeat protein